jgi:hypothetical protein
MLTRPQLPIGCSSSIGLTRATNWVPSTNG